MRQDRWKLTAFLTLSLMFMPPASRAAVPTITSLSITTGAVGASVTITGTNFGATPGTSTVKFNGIAATVASANWTSTVITTTVPSGATSGNVIVTVSGTASNAKTFTVVAAPSITSLTPNSGVVGASVTIAGANFGATQGASTVKFNGTTATVTSANWSATSIKTTVPAGATTGNVIVHASGVDSTGSLFTVLPVPTITSLSISIGAVGASVTISGANFGGSQGTSTLKFNGTTATVATGNWASTSIMTTVPTGATSGNIVVTVSGVSSAGSSFTVVAAPSITTLTPSSGAVGVPVTIAGSNFGSSQGSSTVRFNGVSATVTSGNWSATSINTTVPAAATTGNVIVHASGVDSTGKPFTVVSTPTITSLSISIGAVGASVTISGTNFGGSQGTSTLKFNGTTATVATGNWNPTSIVTTVPTGATSGNIVVTVSGIASIGTPFTVTAPPSITSVTPSAGAVGGSVTITGSNFGSTPGTSTVKFNGVAATVAPANWNATSITTTVPTGATTGNVVVHAAGVDSNGKGFTVAPGSFSLTGGLSAGRNLQTATLLNNGLVLVAGGLDSLGGTVAAAELYNSGTGTFSTTGSLNNPRTSHTATLLSDGRVLIVGGQDNSNNELGSAEIYNPTTGLFTSTGNLKSSRYVHCATLLGNGLVLISGGLTDIGGGLANLKDVGVAELYNPATGTFTLTGSLNVPRDSFTSTLLNNGMVLISGGSNQKLNPVAAELYNPNTGVFSSTGSINTPRNNHSATLLNNGMVLIIGGYRNDTGQIIGTAEVYNPASGSFAATATLTTTRAFHTATLLNNGTVLVAGGSTQGNTAVASAELYDPMLGTFSLTSSMTSSRIAHSSTLLPSGKVLVAGGDINLNGAELYSPISLVPAGLVSIAVTPASPSVPLQTVLGLTAIGTFSDSSTQRLASATWISSNNAVATVTSDVANYGQVYGVALGSPVITACTGAVCGSTTATVITPPTPSITGVNPQLGSIGTQVTITGSAFGNIQGTSTVKFNGVLATPTQWSGTSITTTVPTGATTGNIVVTVAAGGQSLPSNGINFGVSPDILILNPASGPITTSVTINGLSFGSSQAGNTVTFNGVTATPTSWTDTSIVVPVPSGATTGSVVVTVTNIASNSQNFTVTTAVPPTISASVSPAPNANGWNKSNVTVSYTCTPGGLPIVSCPSPQFITTEGANQVVTGSVSDTAGDIATVSVSINLDRTRPILTIASPSEGFTSSNSVVAVTGTASDNLSGPLTITCNGQPTTFSSGSFSCNVGVPNAGANLIMVRATDLAGNVAGSNFHVNYFGGGQPAPNTLQITPTTATMIVGDARQFTAVDDRGLARYDARWSVNGTNLASITTDSSPVLTAIAVGQVTLTATLQGIAGISAQLQINIVVGTSLPAGTTRWTVAPLAPGFSLQSVIQAAPVQGSPDLYTFERSEQNGTISQELRAFTADGRQLWSGGAGIYGGLESNLAIGVADASGGLILLDRSNLGAGVPGTMMNFDGPTGNVIWNVNGYYDTSKPWIAVGPEGHIYYTSAYYQSLVTLDGATGLEINRYIPPSHSVPSPYGGLITAAGAISDAPTVGPDGTVFALVAEQPDPTLNSDRLSLLKMTPDGSASLTMIQDQGSVTHQIINSRVIPDGQGSAFATWAAAEGIHISHVSGVGAGDSILPISLTEMVLDESGVLYALGAQNGTGQSTLLAWNGRVLWSYSVPLPDQLFIVGAVAGAGGVIVNDAQQGLIAFDASGNPGAPSGTPLTYTTPQGEVLSVTSPMALGNYLGPAGGSLSMFKEPTKDPSDTSTTPSLGPNFASSAFPLEHGNGGGQNASPRLTVRTFMPSVPGQAGDPIWGTENGAVNDINTAISADIAIHRIYAISPPLSATIQYFDLVNSVSPLNVLGFIGHATLAAVPNTQPPRSIATGLIFVDNALVRTPDCTSSGNILGICYDLDQSQQTEPCNAGMTPIPSYDGTVVGCYNLTQPNQEVAEVTRVLLTSAHIVFVAACDTEQAFVGWWDMNLNAVPGGRALVAPDIAAMSALPINQGLLQTVSPGAIDLKQGAIAWEALVKSLAAGNNVQKAKDDANTGVANFYGSNPRNLAQVIFKVVGNPNVCPKCKPPQ